MTGVLALLLTAFLGVLSLQASRRSLAWVRLRQAVARADARCAFGRALEGLARWPGMDACATASGNIVSGSARTDWTLCERADGSRAFLVSTLPDDSHAEADLTIVPSDGGSGQAAVCVPSESLCGPDGSAYGLVAWWVSDLGILAPAAPADGRGDASLYALLSASGAEEAEMLTKSGIPGPCSCEDTSLCSSRSAFTLVDSLEGGFREDLSALGDADADSFRNPPAEGQQEWMRSATALDGGLETSPGAGRFEPVVTELALVMGLGADLDQYKSYSTTSLVDIVLSYHLFLEIWNPFTRALELGSLSPDIRVELSGLPRVSIDWANASPSLELPDPLTIDVDCWADLPAGTVQLLSSPESGGGDNEQGVWQAVVGSVRLNKYNYGQNVYLDFSSCSPVLKLYDLSSGSEEPFLTLSLRNYSAFSMDYSYGSNSFCRSATNVTAYGMGREAMNAGGWAFAWHVKLREDFLDDLFRSCDLRAGDIELDASAGGDDYRSVLDCPEDYERDEVLRADDFFATYYSGPPYVNRRALLFDPPADACLSFSGLRHAPYAGHAAFSIGAGTDEEADACLDRYFFSSLPEGEWDGAAALKNYRIVPSERGASVARAPDDAEELLLAGGWNLNTASAEVWASVLRSLAQEDWALEYPSGFSAAVKLEAPFFSLPWSASRPPTEAAADSLVEYDMDAWDCLENPLVDDRLHPAFLVGLRDIGGSVDALAAEIAGRMAERGRPFQSLSELAQSGMIQSAIDSVPEINRYDAGTDALQPGSPSHLEQSELLCALSPILFTRSDTFLVRAFGRDERSGAEACMEAVVQRMPEAVDADAASFGRVFRVLSARWLKASEMP